MGIVKEWICPGHGTFESDDPICPRGGCTVTERAFRTPTGFIGARAKNIDKTLNTLAQSYGMSDMNNHGGTTGARVINPKERQLQEFNDAVKKRFPRYWGDMPKGGAPAALAALKAPAEDSIAGVRDSLVPPRVIGKRDPDAQSVEKVRKAAA